MKKSGLIILSLLLVAPFSQAETLSDALKQCGQQQNSLKRLVCYDRLVNDIEQYSGLNDLLNVPAPLPAAGTSTQSTTPSVPSSAPPRQSSAPAAAPSSSSDFGLEARQIRQDTADKIYSTVKSFKKDGLGNLVITLANGMVWKQLESSSLRIKSDQQVYVEKGLIGSHYLSRDEVNSRIKVKRIK